MLRTIVICWLAVVALIGLPVRSHAQTPAPPPVSAPDDAVVNPAQPDFTVVNLPTTRRLAAMKSAFRVTHRFGRSLTRGSFGDAASNFFGLDSGAQIGLEYRLGLMRGVQAAIYRTSDKTIQFLGQYGVFRQSESKPLAVDVVATIEGLNNFHRGSAIEPEDNEYATSIGALVSRTVGDVAAFYVEPTFIAHSNVYSTAGCLEHLEHGHTIPGCDTVLTTACETGSRSSTVRSLLAAGKPRMLMVSSFIGSPRPPRSRLPGRRARHARGGGAARRTLRDCELKTAC